MAEMRVEQLITRNPVSVGLDTRISTMHEILQKQKFHHILVSDADTLVGVISDIDVYKNLSPWIGTIRETRNDTTTLNLRAHQIMSRDLRTAKADTLVSEAIAIILEHSISILPIVDQQNKAIGVLSWRDILRQILKYKQQM